MRHVKILRAIHMESLILIAGVMAKWLKADL